MALRREMIVAAMKMGELSTTPGRARMPQAEKRPMRYRIRISERHSGLATRSICDEGSSTDWQRAGKEGAYLVVLKSHVA